jgi:dolichyl-phosphate beta-glucosyltransferase
LATLSLVIPAYNEEERLPSLLRTLSESADGAVAAAGMTLQEAIVVDDGSSDRTRELLATAARTDPRLHPVFDLDENRGKGAAFAAGVRQAKGDFVLLADADLSTPIEELGKLTAALAAGADVAIGSRAVEGAIVERGPVHRKALGAAFNLVVRLLTGLRLHDTQCGFKIFPRRAAVRLLEGQTCSGFAFDVELLMRAQRDGLRIAEVPVLYLHDSRSRVRVVSASVRMLRDVSALAYRLRLRGVPRSGPGLADAAADDPDRDARGERDAEPNQVRLPAHRN